MSTRGCIARLLSRDPLRFKGVYHHWDSYPSGLGLSLFRLRNGKFGGDTAAMLDVLIDQHPAGWSTLFGTDFDLKPGFRHKPDPSVRNPEVDRYPQCYCHGDRHEPGHTVTHKNAAMGGMEYAYLFQGSKMLIAASFFEDEERMIGMFGVGDPGAIWAVIAEVDLDGPEPDWEALDQIKRMPVAQKRKSRAGRKAY